MRSNQTGAAVIARDVEDDGDGGRMPVKPEQPCQLEHFSRFKKNKTVCATSRDKNKLSVPVLVIPHAQMRSCC